MMPDPVGTIGAKSSSDMDLVLEGGPNFDQRLKQLTDQRDAASEALRALELGKSIAAARRDAETKKADAERMQAEAAKVLKNAQDKASQIVADAQTDAARIATGAQRVALAKLAEAEQTRKKAEDEMQAGIARAKAAEDEAKHTLASARQTRDSLKEEAERHLNARNLAIMAKSDLDQRSVRLQEKINRLQEVLRELSQE